MRSNILGLCGPNLANLASLAGLASLLVVGGCHHAPPAPTPSPSPNADSVRAARERADAAARAEAARRDSIARAAAVADSVRHAADAARRADDARRVLVAPVHFDFDRDRIRADEAHLLDQKAAVLAANPALRIRIEGNADERGSDEYNLALGMRRAAAVQRYLEAHGVTADRLGVSSNGEEHPLCDAHDESCWGENRRGDIVITAGGEHIVAAR